MKKRTRTRCYPLTRVVVDFVDPSYRDMSPEIERVPGMDRVKKCAAEGYPYLLIAKPVPGQPDEIMSMMLDDREAILAGIDLANRALANRSIFWSFYLPPDFLEDLRKILPSVEYRP